MPIINQQQVQQFGHLEFLARQVVEGFITGLHKSPFHGFSVEFAEHRAYNKGQSTRHIDWKLYARTEKLFVKRYEEETNLRCRLVIDTSSSMYYPESRNNETFDNLNKVGFSIYASAAITHMLRKQRDAVGLSLFSEQVELHTQAKSTSTHHSFLFNKMEKLLEKGEPNRNTFTADALHQIAENTHKRSLVVLFSDMMDNSGNQDEMFAALQHLKHKKHEVILFHVYEQKTEADFDFDNRPYTFVDMESGEEVKLHPNSIKETYLKSMKDYENQLKIKCGQYHIDFVPAPINEGFNQVLLSYLIKRSKLH